LLAPKAGEEIMLSQMHLAPSVVNPVMHKIVYLVGFMLSVPLLAGRCGRQFIGYLSA
jgi:hypothetical protein